MTDLSLEQKVILLTGASGHLGRAMAARLSAAGATVLLNSRSTSRAEALAQKLGGIAMAFDIADEAAVDVALQTIDRDFGRLDGLVNNAYAGTTGSFEQISAANFASSLLQSVTSPFLLIRKSLPLFERAKAPSVVNVASMYGSVSPDPSLYENAQANNPPQYGAGKAGMLQLTRYMAVHLAKQGVRVNAVSPGPFPSEAVQKQNPAFVARLSSRVPLNRIGRPEEIASAVHFLLSDAASYITGVNLPVDGGWTAW